MSKRNPYFNPPRWMPVSIRRRLVRVGFNYAGFQNICMAITMPGCETINEIEIRGYMTEQKLIKQSEDTGDGLLWLAWERLHGGKS